MDNFPHDMISHLHASTKTDWKLKVRVTRIWPLLNHNAEPVAINFIFVDVLGERIHALIAPHNFHRLQNLIIEGETYEINNFVVKRYLDSQKHRCFMNDIFIQLNPMTEVLVAGDVDFISTHVFRFTDLSVIMDFAFQDEFLIDVVGIFQRIQPLKTFRNKYNQEKLCIRFMLNDMHKSTTVIFYDEMAVAFEQAVNDAVQHPIIVIISSCRVHSMRGEPELTNMAATRFFINHYHATVEDLRDALRLAEWRHDD